ncbi:MAG: hypothetical protein HQM10_23650 [Candidatus Riflebacteria bacterium]|nr:hypothetical protein [Candidatus Riflebacteria bacterium]
MLPVICKKMHIYALRRGFVLPLSVVLIPIALLLLFSYNNYIKQEALLAHRVYWNDLITKATEGCAEEAFSWFSKNQFNSENAIAVYLRDTGRSNSFPSSPEPVMQHLGSRELACIKEFSGYFGENIIQSVQISLNEVRHFYKPVTFPQANFDPINSGMIFPDNVDTYGLLKVEIEASYRGLQRKFTAIRDLKCVSILPGIFSQFTLFVKEKLDGQSGDWNQLRNNTSESTATLDTIGIIRKDSAGMNNPITLIHSSDDIKRTFAMSDIKKNDVSPEIGPDWKNIDLTKRGWVFMGRNSTPGILQYYVFHPMFGDIFAASKLYSDSSLPMGHPREPWLYYGGTFMLSNHSKMWYSIRVDDPAIPRFFNHHSIPGSGLREGIRKLYGWMIWQQRMGYTSINKNILSSYALSYGGITLYDILRNYFEDPSYLFGDTPGCVELPHSSIILPMGDLFPESESSLIDRRSPSLMFGVWLKFMQVGNLRQIEDGILPGLTDPLPESGTGSDWLDLYKSSANVISPVQFWFPYFPITLSRDTNRIVAVLNQAKDRIGWANSYWSTVDDGITLPGADFARVRYNVAEILPHFGDPKVVHESLMTKFLVYPGMMIYEQLVGNNMRGSKPSLFVPGGELPADPPLSLKQLPENLSIVLKAIDSHNAPVVGKNAGAQIFYSDPDLSANKGQGISGQGLLLSNLSGKPLVAGNLGAVWPFSKAYNLMQKATDNVPDQKEFKNAFMYEENGVTCLDLKGRIVVVGGSYLELKAYSGDIIHCVSGGMLIASESDIRILNSIKMKNPATDTLVIATANVNANMGKGADISLASGIHEAYFISSGTIKKVTPGSIQINGGLSVRYLEYINSPSSIFSGYPTASSQRQTITWNEKFNVLHPEIYKNSIKIHIGPSMVYSASEKNDQ